MFQVCGSDFSWYLYECIWLRVFLFFRGFLSMFVFPNTGLHLPNV